MSKKILIADDEDIIRNALQLALDIEDYEIHCASDGIKALKKAREVMPDLILLDIMMPGKSGYEVCKELKNDPQTEHIYIIFITARVSRETEIAVQQSGGDELIYKPFDILELRERVKKALQK